MKTDIPDTTGTAETLDRICGVLEIYQARGGYRFGVETLLLAGFIDRPARRLVDLGTGSGVLPLVLVRFGKAERAVGVELQPALADRARRSVAHNGLDERISILEADLRRLDDLLPPASFDLVVSNPPHMPPGEGQVSPNRERALARSELSCRLDDVVAAARRLLAGGERFLTIYPAARLAEVLQACERQQLYPARLRLVHGRAELPARHFLLECRRGSRRQLQVEPPLLVYGADGGYSDEVQGYLYPGGCAGGD